MEPLHTLDCVPEFVRSKPRYVGDHVIRHYRPLGLAALLRDLNAEPSIESLTIEGGIGKLVLHTDGREEWYPTIPGSPIQPPLPASPELQLARRTACRSCDSFKDSRCSASGCGCAGEGKPEIWSSRCPLLKWPNLQLSDALEPQRTA